jgi:DNA-directed RNA polymerase-3 subunit RPC5
MEPMDVDNDDDPVVRELDVYVCNEFAGSKTQLGLLQHPLRPPWRPYEYNKAKAMRFKPQAKRVEVDFPLDTESRNYNDVIEDFKKIDHFTLRSTLAEERTNLTVGTIRGGKLLVAPLDFAVQLRPTMYHLNVSSTAKDKKKDDSDEEEEDEPKLHAVEVQVQKRETERQAQARKNSYAYLTSKEEEEPFVNLKVHGEESDAAVRIWDMFMSAKDVDQSTGKLDRQVYLRAIVPPNGTAPGGLGGAAQADGAAAGGAGAAGATGVAGAAAGQLSEGARAALPLALRALFREHTVCSMGNVRSWLDSSPVAAAAKEAALLPDKVLHDVVLSAGNVVSMHRVYVAAKTGDEKMDPLRKLVVELLEAKESFKRSEFNDLARTNNMTFTESQYNKVVKDICESRGNTWIIKNGASGI